ncbi:MAG: DUF736 domain-containing protein [Sphingobium sp.]|nr:DUF736 domain-containing protein [Sphingobium sp.]
MNIGEITLQKGRLMGAIATRSLDLPEVGLRPVQSDHERAPLYEIVTRNVGGRWVQIGALWSEIRKATGEEYLQGSIDDPSLPEAIPIALFGNTTEGYRVAWKRPQPRDNFAPAARRTQEGGRTERGGFGDSTAGADGELLGAGGSIDEEMPF